MIAYTIYQKGRIKIYFQGWWKGLHIEKERRLIFFCPFGWLGLSLRFQYGKFYNLENPNSVSNQPTEE